MQQTTCESGFSATDVETSISGLAQAQKQFDPTEHHVAAFRDCHLPCQLSVDFVSVAAAMRRD
jgi:hypothetical protein